MDLKMEVYTPALELIGFLEIQQAVIWEEKAFSSGSFSVESLITSKSLEMLNPENIIWIEGETAGIIEYVQEESGENGPYITVKGRTLTGILDRRVLWGLYSLKGTVPAIMHQLVNDCCINPTRGDVESRKIPGLVLADSLAPSSRLPDGYTELEYIESSGTQYIDTKFYPTSETRIVLDAKFGSYKKVAFYGTRPQYDNEGDLQDVLFHTGASSIRLDYFGGDYKTLTVDLSERVVIDQNKNVLTVGASSITLKQPTDKKTAPYPLSIFALNEVGSVGYNSSYSLYSCQIYDNNVLVRDFIPCTNPDSVAGLYDLAGKMFYPNAGKGTFTTGPEAPQAAAVSETSGDIIQIQATGGTLLERLETLGETYGVAFGVRFNPAVPQMEFWTRWGQNRSIHQSENNPVLYSTELDDVLSSEYTYSSQDYRNVALVAGEGEGNDRVLVTVELEVEQPDVPVPPTPPDTSTPVTKYTVTLLADPEGGGTVSGGKTVAAGVTVAVTASPASDYTFVEWRENGVRVSGDRAYTFTVNSDRTLTAVFSAIVPTYTIKTTVEPSGSGNVTGVGQYKEGETVNLVATANEGYNFTDWKESGFTVHSEPNYTFTAEKDRDLVAGFEEKKASRLPDGYTELEYIQSSGTQYINTGRKPTTTTTLTMDVEPTEAATSTVKYFYDSYIYTSGTLGYFFRCNWSTSGVRCNKGYTSQSSVSSYITLSSNVTPRRMTIVEDHKTMKAYIVGEAEYPMSGNATTTNMPTIRLLVSSSGTASARMAAKLYSCTIDDADGSMKFVPCKSPSGEVGLYDLAGGTFYGNSGTGSFTAGPAV